MALRMQSSLPRVQSVLSLLVIAVAMPALGCAGTGKNAIKRRVSELREEVTRLQNEQDRLEERLSALEMGGAPAAAPQRAATEMGDEPVKRPKLKVIRLGPDSPEPEASEQPDGEEAAGAEPQPEATAPRPVLRLRSTAPSPLAASQSGTARLPLAAVGEYKQALSLVRERRFEEAKKRLTQFLFRYVNHPYSDNALYWRGECQYAGGKFDRAAKDFSAVVRRFPHGNKVPDALLKLGMCQIRLGKKHLARATFARLRQHYPKATATRRIPGVG